ncbi:carboxypeptidase regulatory-like domain-containing protein, partial [Microvirga sp. 3-52]|nr:carboxypeptidase regulatory-like domain-containing protein [Microvirga sp. 3-52]
ADMNKKGIADASLTLISPENKFEKVEMTNKEGTYQFDQLLAGDYEITLEANGYQTVKRTFMLEAGEELELDFTLSEFNIAVLGDINNDLEKFFADNEFPAQSRAWDIVDDVYNYDVIVVNSGKGTTEQVNKLIAESDKHETSLIFVDTWGPDGSMKLLEKATGNPTRAKQG